MSTQRSILHSACADLILHSSYMNKKIGRENKEKQLKLQSITRIFQEFRCPKSKQKQRER
jgi:hypothetical protein